MPIALGYAIQILGILPQLIAAGRDVTALIQQGQAVLSDAQANGREPTDADWNELNAQIKALQDELHA